MDQRCGSVARVLSVQKVQFNSEFNSYHLIRLDKVGHAGKPSTLEVDGGAQKFKVISNYIRR